MAVALKDTDSGWNALAQKPSSDTSGDYADAASAMKPDIMPEFDFSKKQLPDKADVPEFDFSKKVLPSAVPKKGFTDYAKDVGRQVGLAGRYGIEGIASLPAAAANVPAYASNKLLGTQFPEQNYAISSLLTQAGFPEPQNSTERVVGDISRSIAGGGGTIKGAETLGKMATSPATKKIMEILAANPKVQGISSITGPGAGGVARELGANPVIQAITSILFGAAPVGVANVPNATQSALRGGATPQQIKQNITNFKAAGTTPSVGQATEGRTSQALETVLSKVPGGAGVMKKAAEKQASEIGGGIENIASQLAGKTDPTITGRAIEKGVTESFIPQARKTQTQLYKGLDTLISPQKEFDVNNFTKIVDTLNKPIKGAENLSNTAIFVNNTIKDIQAALKRDLGGSPAKPSTILDASGNPMITPAVPGKTTLPYTAIKELRTRIGEKLDQYDLSPDLSRTELKRLYGALSEDMKGAAKASGPQAEAAFNRANNYTKALHDRIDLLQGVLDKNGGYEKVFNAAMSGTSEGATTLNAVMKALPDDGKKVFTSTVLRRMGKANPSNQTDVGDVFSTEKFLTSWNKLDSRAKTALFGNQSKQFNDDISKISAVASNLRKGSKVFANPSGTAQMENLIKTYGSVGTGILAFFSGNPGTAAAIGGGIGASNMAARAMTNPDFVHWIASNIDKPATLYPQAVNELVQIAARKNDDELKEVAEELKKMAPKDKQDSVGVQSGFQKAFTSPSMNAVTPAP